MNFLALLSPSDAVALSLLGAMFLTLLAVGSLILVMVNNVQRREEQDLELERLLNEVEDEEGEKKREEPITGKEDQAPLEDWEQEADWWKKS